jgi:hypothetical protein
MNCYFKDLMLEQLCRRYKIGPTYNEQASAWIIASFSIRFGLLGGKDVLEDRYLRLMKYYTDFKDLLNQNARMALLGMKFAK